MLYIRPGLAELTLPRLEHSNTLCDICMGIFYAIFSVNGADVDSVSHFLANFAWNGLKNVRKFGRFVVRSGPDDLEFSKERLYRRIDLIQWTLRDCLEVNIEGLQLSCEAAALPLLIHGLGNFLGPVVLFTSK